jgi:hypothetical protein
MLRVARLGRVAAGRLHVAPAPHLGGKDGHLLRLRPEARADVQVVPQLRGGLDECPGIVDDQRTQPLAPSGGNAVRGDRHQVSRLVAVRQGIGARGRQQHLGGNVRLEAEDAHERPARIPLDSVADPGRECGWAGRRGVHQ